MTVISDTTPIISLFLESLIMARCLGLRILIWFSGRLQTESRTTYTARRLDFLTLCLNLSISELNKGDVLWRKRKD